jgi:L-histidine N-alpha-methyltransferase
VADLNQDISLPDALPRPLVVAFLGSTIGNFEESAAAALLRRVRGHLGPDDRFLLGVDLIKDPAVLEAAYNDARGITADFNLNMLDVLNRELGTDFDREAFRHRAVWSAERHRMEMHLVASASREVVLPGVGSIRIAAGESLRTEISCKYDRRMVEGMFGAAGLRLERWQPDPRNWFALAVGAPADQG